MGLDGSLMLLKLPVLSKPSVLRALLRPLLFKEFFCGQNRAFAYIQTLEQ